MRVCLIVSLILCFAGSVKFQVIHRHLVPESTEVRISIMQHDIQPVDYESTYSLLLNDWPTVNIKLGRNGWYDVNSTEPIVYIIHVVRYHDGQLVEIMHYSEIEVNGAKFWSYHNNVIEAEEVPDRRVYPQTKPLVTFAFVSCLRYYLLKETLDSVINHMENVEPDVPYEFVWIDNQAQQEGFDIQTRYKIEKAMLLPSNYGLSFTLNTWYALSSAPYLVQMEEDWLTRTDQEMQFISMGMDVLQHDPSILLVTLRFFWDEYYAPMNFTVGEWQVTANGTEYRSVCGDPPKDFPYGGSHSMGPCVADVERIRSVGGWNVKEMYDCEYGFPRRARRMGYCMAEMRMDPLCNSTRCNVAYLHTGFDASPCSKKNFDSAEAYHSSEAWRHVAKKGEEEGKTKEEIQAAIMARHEAQVEELEKQAHKEDAQYTESGAALDSSSDAEQSSEADSEEQEEEGEMSDSEELPQDEEAEMAE